MPNLQDLTDKELMQLRYECMHELLDGKLFKKINEEINRRNANE